jgi:hypothetical protein
MLQLPGGPDDDHVRQQKFEEIAKAMPGFGGKSVEIRFGAAVATFSGGTGSNIVNVEHGLGRVPQAVSVLADSSAINVFGQKNGAATTTILPISLTAPLGAYTGNVTFYWIAIG